MGSILEESRKSRSMGGFKITKKKIIISVIIFLVLFLVYFYFNKKDEKGVVVSQKEWTVKKDNLKISIEADGKVVAEDGVELSFSVSGNNLEVKEVFVKEGDKVKKGDKIATVKTETLQLNVRTAYSSYLSALASHNRVMDGATSEQIADAKDAITSAEISLNQSKISLENTKQSAEDSIYNAEKDVKDAKDNLDNNKNELSSDDVEDAYKDSVDTIKSINITLDDVLKDSDKILGIDEVALNDAFETVLSVKNTSALIFAKTSYLKSKAKLSELNSLVLSLNTYSLYNEIDVASEKTSLALQEFERHLYDMKLVLDATITSSGLSQTALNSLMSTISSNRTTINTKIGALNTSIEAVDDAKDSLDDYVDDYEDALRELENSKADTGRSIENSEATVKSRELSLEQAKRNHDDLVAPLTESEKASARSSLTSASVSLKKSQNELENATIISPIDGEVARLNYKGGDIIVDQSTADPVINIINNDTLFVEVDIEEADINKVQVGQNVYAVFDALDSLSLNGEVSFISLTSKTNNSGIVTYLVRIVIDKEGAQVREGMTAFVDFVTAEAKNVLIIPVSAVSNVGDKPSVLDVNGQWVPVVTGFTDGKNVEVISGLSAGDKIIY